MEQVRLCTGWPRENWLGTSKTTYRVGWMIWMCYSHALEIRCLEHGRLFSLWSIIWNLLSFGFLLSFAVASQGASKKCAQVASSSTGWLHHITLSVTFLNFSPNLKLFAIIWTIAGWFLWHLGCGTFEQTVNLQRRFLTHATFLQGFGAKKPRREGKKLEY